MPRSQGVALSLFWRTFVLLAILLGSGIMAWVWTLRSLEFEPRAVAASQ
jgi:two-component system, OmpR family, osmolarity sensor histidine kinase EnvZ